MAAVTVIPVSEYLHTVYRPDWGYVDEVIEERTWGELDHSDLQGRFLNLLGNEQCRPYFRANVELCVQVSATRYRIPDVCLRPVPASREQIVRTPPLLCIEVLSPEDTLAPNQGACPGFLRQGRGRGVNSRSGNADRTSLHGEGNTVQTAGRLTVPNTRSGWMLRISLAYWMKRRADEPNRQLMDKSKFSRYWTGQN